MSTLGLPALATDLLGRDVVGRREGRRRARQRESALDHLVCHPEIDEADRAVVAEDDVLGFQVVVHDLMAMHVVHGVAQAARDAQRLRLRQAPALADAAGESRSLHVLRHDEVTVLLRCQGDEAQDGRMVELAADLGFVLEHRPASKTARELRQGNLHGHEPAALLEVLRFEHGGHAASSDLLEEQEAAFEGLAGSGSRRERHALAALYRPER